MKRITFGAGVLALAASVVSAQQVKVDPAKIEEQLKSLPGIELPPPIQFDTPPVIK